MMETLGGNLCFLRILTQVSDFRNHCQTNIGIASIGEHTVYWVESKKPAALEWPQVAVCLEKW